MTWNRRVVLRVLPVLHAAMFAVATVEAMDTDPWDGFHDVIAWIAAAGMLVTAVRPTFVVARTAATAAAVAALICRLLWWWSPSAELLPMGAAYPTAVLIVLTAQMVVWAWTADFLVMRDRERT